MLSEMLRLWAELSGVKILGSRPYREGYLVNEVYYVYQVGADICQEKLKT
jgi:hypothetical protein